MPQSAVVNHQIRDGIEVDVGWNHRKEDDRLFCRSCAIGARHDQSPPFVPEDRIALEVVHAIGRGACAEQQVVDSVLIKVGPTGRLHCGCNEPGAHREAGCDFNSSRVGESLRTPVEDDDSITTHGRETHR
jgi:hypothetical protein